MSWLAVLWFHYFAHLVTPVERRTTARSVLVVSMYVRARQRRVTITFYSVFVTIPFWGYFLCFARNSIIILSCWKSIWLMKNIKLPKPDVSVQSKHLQAVFSADTEVSCLFFCRFHEHFYAPHPYICNSDITYDLQKQFASSSSYFLSNSKTFMPFSGFQISFLHLFSIFLSFYRLNLNRFYLMNFYTASSFICSVFDLLDLIILKTAFDMP